MTFDASICSCVLRCAVLAPRPARARRRRRRRRSRRRPARFEQKMAWILRLEDQRVLRDPAPAVAPPAPPPRRRADRPAPVGRAAAAAARSRSACCPTTKRASAAARRWRSATSGSPKACRRSLAVLGRPRSRSAADGGVRARPARRHSARAIRWSRALADPSPLVQGSAAEALGLIGDAAAADAVGRLVAPDRAVGRARADRRTKTTMRGATRRRRRAASAIYALVRLKAYPQLAAAVLDASGQPRVRWWPVAFALQRLEDKRALPALLTLAKDAQPVHARVRGQGARRAEGSHRRCRC